MISYHHIFGLLEPNLFTGGENLVPIYEYVCQSCGTEFEKLVRSMTASVPAECPECKSKEVKKAFSLFGMGRAGSESSSATSAASCGPASA